MASPNRRFDSTNEDLPASRTYVSSASDIGSLDGLSESHADIVLPSEGLADLILAGEEALMKGLKLEYLKKRVLWNLCLRRGLPLPPKPVKEDMVQVLDEWVCPVNLSATNEA